MIWLASDHMRCHPTDIDFRSQIVDCGFFRRTKSRNSIAKSEIYNLKSEIILTPLFHSSIVPRHHLTPEFWPLLEQHRFLNNQGLNP
jgi:hypothetical protein